MLHICRRFTWWCDVRNTSSRKLAAKTYDNFGDDYSYVSGFLTLRLHPVTCDYVSFFRNVNEAVRRPVLAVGNSPEPGPNQNTTSHMLEHWINYRKHTRSTPAHTMKRPPSRVRPAKPICETPTLAKFITPHPQPNGGRRRVVARQPKTSVKAQNVAPYRP